MPEQPQDFFLEAAQPVADTSVIAMSAKKTIFTIVFIIKSN